MSVKYDSLNSATDRDIYLTLKWFAIDYAAFKSEERRQESLDKTFDSVMESLERV